MGTPSHLERIDHTTLLDLVATHLAPVPAGTDCRYHAPGKPAYHRAASGVLQELNDGAFAEYVRTLGRGKRARRSLTREEARNAMQMILDGKVEDVQLGLLF